MPRPSTVRAPATRDQADAYRFGLRRMEAALVRGDPVPLHEQIRSQRRAALVGVALGLLGICFAALVARVAPSPRWTDAAVVVGADSGAMYVVAHGPDRLVPVANLPAARLVLAALRAAGSTDADAAGATPVTVPDSSLDGAARTATAAVPGAVAVRPDSAVLPRWAVCDRTTADGTLVGTTVLAGMPAPPGPMPPGDGVLLDGPDGVTWLVTAGRRHRVDVGDGRLLAAFGLIARVPRAAAPDLVSLVPEGVTLATPEVAGRGRPAPGGLPGRIGDVLETRPVGGAARHFVVLADGVQEVPDVLAELLRVAAGQARALPFGIDQLAGATLVDHLPTQGWPSGAPRLRESVDAPVLCWTWTAEGEPSGAVWAGAAEPVPTPPVSLAQADGPGPKVDLVAVGPGGAVRATGSGRSPAAGPLWLVSATGVTFGVVDDATAAALGITTTQPAPEAVLRLLPTGPALDLAAAGGVVDVLPAG